MTPRPLVAALLNKVPEITIWFWIIKILCTTVGESFADWIAVDLGVGLINTTLIFTVVLSAVLTWQIRLPKYNPFSYWLAVVVLSVTGTLYTDILTDRYGVDLAITTSVVATMLAVVFYVWYRKEHTLSIHSIVTVRRETFYWLAIFLTFALGTAAGDWTLEITGWTPGIAVLLPTFLIVAVVVGWWLGANAVLSFWIAYVLTRPLGANLGDWIAVDRQLGGLGLGTLGTSVIFLGAIAGTVIYLAIKRPDVIDDLADVHEAAVRKPDRERRMLRYYGSGRRSRHRHPGLREQSATRSVLGAGGSARRCTRRAADPATGHGEPARRERHRDPHDHPRHPRPGRGRRPERRNGSSHRPRDRMGRRPTHPRTARRSRMELPRQSDR